MSDELTAWAKAAAVNLSQCAARIEELEADRDAWRVRAEQAEGERNGAWAEVARLRSELVLARASAQGAGSLLLDVQNECIAWRVRAEQAESRVAVLEAMVAEVPRLREALRGLLDAVDTVEAIQHRIVVDPYAMCAARAVLEAEGSGR